MKESNFKVSVITMLQFANASIMVSHIESTKFIHLYKNDNNVQVSMTNETIAFVCKYWNLKCLLWLIM